MPSVLLQLLSVLHRCRVVPVALRLPTMEVPRVMETSPTETIARLVLCRVVYMPPNLAGSAINIYLPLELFRLILLVLYLSVRLTVELLARFLVTTWVLFPCLNRQVMELGALTSFLPPANRACSLEVEWPAPLAVILTRKVAFEGLQFLQATLRTAVFFSLLAFPPTVCLTPLPGADMVPVLLTVVCRCGPRLGLLLLSPVVSTTLRVKWVKIPFPPVLLPVPMHPTPDYPPRFDTEPGTTASAGEKR